MVTVCVQTDAGIKGTGYTYTVGSGGSAITRLLADELAPLLCGCDPRCTEQTWRQMWRHLHYVGRGGLAGFAVSAVDIALWDIKAQAGGEPLWRLLGGASSRVPAYAGGVDLHFTTEELLAEMDDYLAQGFHALKIKVGHDDLKQDIERVAAVRRRIGPDVVLMLDANMRWRLDEALRAVKALRDFDPFWLEEPFEPDYEEAHATLAARGIPIATGENLHTIAEFQRMMDRGGVSFVQPDLTNAGGVTGWMKVAHAAECRNLPVSSHGAHDLHVHLLCAVANASYLEVHRFGLDRFLAAPLTLEDGCAVAPDRPGHGLQFKWDDLEAFRIASGDRSQA
ncbi:MAG: mandelate racemase/muconate lactonizing enzyme family protein [Spirochaetaceae bacterium]|nr:MAG: mandelate racemase/muconate lactonizing enzyme family protein [Spirochaetaceae bacterium]